MRSGSNELKIQPIEARIARFSKTAVHLAFVTRSPAREVGYPAQSDRVSFQRSPQHHDQSRTTLTRMRCVRLAARLPGNLAARSAPFCFTGSRCRFLLLPAAVAPSITPQSFPLWIIPVCLALAWNLRPAGCLTAPGGSVVGGQQTTCVALRAIFRCGAYAFIQLQLLFNISNSFTHPVSPLALGLVQKHQPQCDLADRPSAWAPPHAASGHVHPSPRQRGQESWLAQRSEFRIQPCTYQSGTPGSCSIVPFVGYW